MNVSDVMSKSVTTAPPTMKLKEVWKLIFSKNINALPVIDANKKLVGIVTKDDLLSKLYPDYDEFIADFASASDFEAMENKLQEILTSTARDVMNKRVVFTRVDTPALRALSRMIARHVNQLPVLGEGDRVIGMVTKGDIFRALFQQKFATIIPGKKQPKRKS
ncbi:hypothetical protein A2Z33_05025 [Candidatus Gottesmanbacteria bacterium RBG_16_52_11]|uniref:CBS domain-containing protein n=1 Tax=Candidatus Gottesmanbacteria bacterium RBG_16_52_11 TaxID=1798374 RepID=A0A1F5YQJ1_9BACT|nr:MAG: hypothetical protein A2Z33_05025 [Candidatus Gottesmanbacteria bacterium RBG_16_52_11]